MNVTPSSGPAGFPSDRLTRDERGAGQTRRAVPRTSVIAPPPSSCPSAVGSFYPSGPAGHGMWVRSEYAGELAVLSTWLCALLPWSLSYATLGDLRLFRIHFLPLFVQYVLGIDLGDVEDPVVLVHEAPGFTADSAVTLGYRLWGVAALVFAGCFAWSVLYYVHDERLEARSPLDPVRVSGGLLLASALPLTAATYYLGDGFSGITIPIGVAFMYLFGGLLLVVDRT